MEHCAECIDDDARAAHAAFDGAIESGRLSADWYALGGGDHPLYAGDYMYMGTFEGKDQFKHRDTRQYLE